FCRDREARPSGAARRARRKTRPEPVSFLLRASGLPGRLFGACSTDYGGATPQRHLSKTERRLPARRTAVLFVKTISISSRDGCRGGTDRKGRCPRRTSPPGDRPRPVPRSGT